MSEAEAAPAPETPAPQSPASPVRPRRPPRRWRRILARITEVLTIAGGLGALLLWCSVPNTARLATENPTTTAFIELRREQAAAAARKLELKWQWRSLGKISRYLRAAVIYAEDMKFYSHGGVDWGAIEQAVESNWDKGSLAIGGSTITQQLAKNLYLSPRRSIFRKAREMMIAFSLEDHLSKQRILELYLNVVEWGDGVFGAEAAARHWFGRSAQTLSPAEAARLAIALPNPIERAPNVRNPAQTRRAVRVIHLLRMQGLMDEGQERAALDQVGAPEEPVLPSRKRPPESGPAQPGTPQPGPEEPRPPEPGPPEPAPQPPVPTPQPPVPGSPVPGSPGPGLPVPGSPVPGLPVPGSPVPGLPVPAPAAPPAPAPAAPPAPAPAAPPGPASDPPAAP